MILFIKNIFTVDIYNSVVGRGGRVVVVVGVVWRGSVVGKNGTPIILSTIKMN